MNNRPVLANDRIDNLSESEIQGIQDEVEAAFSQVLKALRIDTENDHNTKGTAKRVAKMYVREIFKGRYMAPPRITTFPNAKNLDQIYTVGPITIRSTCSHHFVPITGKVWVGVIPGETVIGLSKFNRLIDWIMSRPHIQEEATVMLADTLEEMIKPLGLAVVMQATHLCMTHRGVREHDTDMVTSIMRGKLRENPSAKAEFMDIIKSQGFH